MSLKARTVPSRLVAYQSDVLEMLCLNEQVRSWEMPDLSGYEESTIVRALRDLRRIGLLDNHLHRWVPTEKGKIVFALIVGKRFRRRYRLRKARTHAISANREILAS